MTNIIQFPVEFVQGWNLIGKLIREILTEHGASEIMTAHICKKMKQHWEKINVQFKSSLSYTLPQHPTPKDAEELKVAIQKMLEEDFGKQIQQFTNQMLLEILKLEIESYSAKYPSSTDSPA